MFKKTFISIVSLMLIISAWGCSDKGTKNSNSENKQALTEESGAVITNSVATKEMSLDWFFIPEESTNIKTRAANTKRIEVSFKGCGYKEINRYGTEIETVLKRKFGDLYTPIINENGVITGLTKATTAKEVIKNENFSGPAYGFIYKTNEKFITVTVKYYGSAGGSYGNGQCKVIIENSSETYLPFSEVADNGK